MELPEGTEAIRPGDLGFENALSKINSALMGEELKDGEKDALSKSMIFNTSHQIAVINLTEARKILPDVIPVPVEEEEE